MTFSLPVCSADAPELGDPYSQTMSLKTEKIIGFSSYKRLQKYNQIPSIFHKNNNKNDSLS